MPSSWLPTLSEQWRSLSSPLLIVTGRASVIALAVVAFIVVTGKVFFDPAAQALLPHLVGRKTDVLTRANGRLFAGETVGQSLVGPPLGGFIFSLAPSAPFVLDAISFSASAAFLARVPRQPVPQRQADQTVAGAIKEGFAYLLRSRELLLLSACTMAFNIGWNMAAATFVLYAKDSLRASDLTFGLLISASAIGGILAGWRSGPILRLTTIKGAAIGSLLVQAIGWITIVASGSVWIAGVGYALVGAAATLSTVAVVSARQQTVPDHLLGRVVSAFRLLGNGVGPLGAAAGGLIASAAGLHAPFIVASALLVGAGAVVAIPLFRTSH